MSKKFTMFQKSCHIIVLTITALPTCFNRVNDHHTMLLVSLPLFVLPFNLFDLIEFHSVYN